MPDATFEFSLATPFASGPVAIIDLSGRVEHAFQALGAESIPLAPGVLRLRALSDIDTGLIAVLSPTRAQLMPHGGPRIVEKLCALLESSGGRWVERLDPLDSYPEARDRFEALMLAALARAHSPRAVDLLLEQPSRWRTWHRLPEADRAATLPALQQRSAALRHLLTPPRIAVLGPPNVGKSTLTNALARRTVSLTSNDPGTTRDDVGLLLNLDGLSTWWFDTPGRRFANDPVEHAAISLSDARLAGCDLIILARDPFTTYVSFRPPDPARPPIRVLLRSDLMVGRATITSDDDFTLSVATDSDLSDFARRIRRVLVPDSLLADSVPWLFDHRLL